MQRQAETGRLFGETAVELGLVSEEEVRRATEEQSGFSVLRADDARIDPLVVTAFDPLAPLARTARNLRATLTAATRADGGPVRTVALIGLGTAGEVPVLAANLAVACAQAGAATLLVDAGLEQPHHQTFFRVRNRAGLTTLLSGAGSTGLIQPTAIPGLAVLTSGPPVPNAPELLDAQRLANELEAFVEDYKLVLVDAGSGSTGLAVTLGLDACVVVLRRNVSPTRDLKLLVDQLQANGQTVLGTVLVE